MPTTTKKKRGAKRPKKALGFRLETMQTGEVRLFVPVKDLHEDPSNAREHNAKNLASIRGSIEEYDQQKPLVITPKGKVLAGNGTLRTVIEMGRDDVWVTVSGLEGLQEVGYSIADNRTGELGEWDYETLSSLMRQLMEEDERLIASIGFEKHELEPLLQAEWTAPPPSDGGLDADPDTKVAPIKVTLEQRIVIDRSVTVYREQFKRPDVNAGDVVTRLCQAFLKKYDCERE